VKRFLKFVLVSLLFFSVIILPYTYLATESGQTITAASAKSKSIGEFRKGPYLIYRGNNASMMLLWQLHGTKNCTLEWGEDNSYSQGKAETKEYGKDHQHAYTVEGLKPGNRYYYRISAGAEKNLVLLMQLQVMMRKSLSSSHTEIADHILEHMMPL